MGGKPVFTPKLLQKHLARQTYRQAQANSGSTNMASIGRRERYYEPMPKNFQE